MKRTQKITSAQVMNSKSQQQEQQPIVFVTGTDTDVGKTFVSTLLVHKWKAAYWKPVQTGIESDQGDSETLKNFKIAASTWQPPIFTPTYALQKPLSPLQAMEYEPNVDIRLLDFVVPEEWSTENPLVVEGAGGVCVPITRKLEITTDLIKHLIETSGHPVYVVVVARSGLGTLNHTLLTWNHLCDNGLRSHLFGVILNGEPNEGNVQALKKFGVNIMAQVAQCTTAHDQDMTLHELPSVESLMTQQDVE